MSKKDSFKTGFARADITPLERGSNYKRKTLELPPQGEPGLECLAALFSVGEERVGLIVLDTLCLSRELVLRIREEVKARDAFSSLKGLIIAATHSHSTPLLGPTVNPTVSAGSFYEDRVVVAVLESLEKARERLQGTRLRAGLAPAPGLEFNRRYLRKDGRIVMGLAEDIEEDAEPTASVDSEIPFWWFESISGEPRGIIFSYANHNNAARSANPFFTPDFAGYGRRVLEEEYGENFTALMLEGTCGNVVWTDPWGKGEEKRGGIGQAKKIGQRLAQAISGAVDSASQVNPSPLRYRNRALLIPERTLEESSWCEDGCWGPPVKDTGKQAKEYEIEKKEISRRPNMKCLVEINTLILGSTALVTNPAELFVCFGKEIRSRSPYPVTLVGELTNGCLGYVPAEKDFAQGGYETHRSVYGSRLATNAGRLITDASLDLLRD